MGVGIPWLSWFVAASLQFLLPSSHHHLLCVPVSSLCLSLLIIGFKPHLGNPARFYLKIFNLITFTKKLFPSEITFTDSRNLHTSFWGYHSTHYRVHGSSQVTLFPENNLEFKSVPSASLPVLTKSRGTVLCQLPLSTYSKHDPYTWAEGPPSAYTLQEPFPLGQQLHTHERSFIV